MKNLNPGIQVFLWHKTCLFNEPNELIGYTSILIYFNTNNPYICLKKYKFNVIMTPN